MAALLRVSQRLFSLVDCNLGGECTCSEASNLVDHAICLLGRRKKLVSLGAGSALIVIKNLKVLLHKLSAPKINFVEMNAASRSNKSQISDPCRAYLACSDDHQKATKSYLDTENSDHSGVVTVQLKYFASCQLTKYGRFMCF